MGTYAKPGKSCICQSKALENAYTQMRLLLNLKDRAKTLKDTTEVINLLTWSKSECLVKCKRGYYMSGNVYSNEMRTGWCQCEMEF